MRVLVTGASGTIGSAVTRALLRRGHEVVGVVSMAGRPVPEPATQQVADLCDRAGLATLGKIAVEVDAAVHAASSNDERAGALDGTVVEALVAAFDGSDRPLVYTSGLWLHGNTGDAPATEDSAFAPPQVVAWRPDLERSVAAAATRGVRTVRIRPALVYGGGRGYIPVVLAPDGGVVRHFGDGHNRWAVVHVDDLGDLYALAVESAPAGSVFLGTTDQPVRVRDAAQVIADRHGARTEPWDPAEASRHWGPMVEPFLLDQVATGAKARRELGWRPHRPGLLDELSG